MRMGLERLDIYFSSGNLAVRSGRKISEDFFFWVVICS